MITIDEIDLSEILNYTLSEILGGYYPEIEDKILSEIHERAVI